MAAPFGRAASLAGGRIGVGGGARGVDDAQAVRGAWVTTWRESQAVPSRAATHQRGWWRRRSRRGQERPNRRAGSRLATCHGGGLVAPSLTGWPWPLFIPRCLSRLCGAFQTVAGDPVDLGSTEAPQRRDRRRVAVACRSPSPRAPRPDWVCPARSLLTVRQVPGPSAGMEGRSPCSLNTHASQVALTGGVRRRATWCLGVSVSPSASTTQPHWPSPGSNSRPSHGSAWWASGRSTGRATCRR